MKVNHIEHWMLERRVLTACALRFDGWKYWKKRCRHYGVPDNDMRPLVLPGVDTRAFHEEPLDNHAAFFGLQRFLGKFGGERHTPFTVEHIVFRMLFLHLYREDVPREYRDQKWYDEWLDTYARKKELYAAEIRRTFTRRGTGPKFS